jgi:hypothetical protein
VIPVSDPAPHAEFDESEIDAGFEPARFPIDIQLPDGDEQSLAGAREAVLREFRDSVRWKRLRCRGVTKLTEREGVAVYVLEVGHAIEFDWTWEGAVAFRPLGMKEFLAAPDAYLGVGTNESDAPEFAATDSILWSGEVLEVDDTAGRLFVSVSNPEYPPTSGSFYVRPFEFLACLNAVFNEPAFEHVRKLLPARLRAAEGGVHPPLAAGHEGLGLPALRPWWGHAWSLLWGPPGTGKTYTTGQQVARVLQDPTERILVVSTTNRATDAVALAIGKAAQVVNPQALASNALLRIGKGAALRQFQTAGLESMLAGTETELLAQIEQLVAELSRAPSFEAKSLLRQEIYKLRQQMRDAAAQSFFDPAVRVVIGTAFRATSFLKMEELRLEIERGTAPFTTIFIDEAGLISRAAAATLSLLASRRVVLVGDSKQLAPISRISRILPTNQMTWLANSGLSHLQHIEGQHPAVHVLREQHRMHPEVCAVVSHYQYDGFLTTAPQVLERSYELPSILVGQSRALWYVLDDAGEDLASIRAERGPGNRSWVRSATPRVLSRLFRDPALRRVTGLFISPYKAQAKAIATLLASNSLSSWSSSTVHSQQGAEADVVIFDTVNAGSYSWPYDEWKRLVNVALSRAKESVIVLASRAEMQEPYLRPLQRRLPDDAYSVFAGLRRGAVLGWCQITPDLQVITPFRDRADTFGLRAKIDF